jgi:hypothetical protein
MEHQLPGQCFMSKFLDVLKTLINNDLIKLDNHIIIAPSKKRGYIVLLMFVCLSVCPLADHMVSADYLKNYLSQSQHISHTNWS